MNRFWCLAHPGVAPWRASIILGCFIRWRFFKWWVDFCDSFGAKDWFWKRSFVPWRWILLMSIGFRSALCLTACLDDFALFPCFRTAHKACILSLTDTVGAESGLAQDTVFGWGLGWKWWCNWQCFQCPWCIGCDVLIFSFVLPYLFPLFLLYFVFVNFTRLCFWLLLSIVGAIFCEWRHFRWNSWGCCRVQADHATVSEVYSWIFCWWIWDDLQVLFSSIFQWNLTVNLRGCFWVRFLHF